MIMRSFWLIFVVFIIECNSSNAKIGVCATAGQYSQNANCSDMVTLNAHAWYYNWATENTYAKIHCKPLPSGEFVPMIKTHSNVNDNIPGEFSHILGFNEPNHKSQANMSPQQAVKDWKVIQKKYAGKKLVSPSAAPCGGSD
eukprot:881265_1